jgi:hypothetical protein
MAPFSLVEVYLLFDPEVETIRCSVTSVNFYRTTRQQKMAFFTVTSRVTTCRPLVFLYECLKLSYVGHISWKTSVKYYRTTRRHISEARDLNTQCYVSPTSVWAKEWSLTTAPHKIFVSKSLDSSLIKNCGELKFCNFVNLTMKATNFDMRMSYI